MSKRSVKRYSRSAAWLGIPGLRPVVYLLVNFYNGFRGIRSTGRANVPRTGGLLIIANHISDFDPVALQYGCPRPIHYMAKQELFEDRRIAGLMRFFNAFPVRQGEPDKAALRHAIDLLRAGECVGIFPEGKLSETDELLPLQPGVDLIARSAGVPVLACVIRGTNGLVPHGKLSFQKNSAQIALEFKSPYCFALHEDAATVIEWMKAELTA